MINFFAILAVDTVHDDQLYQGCGGLYSLIFKVGDGLNLKPQHHESDLSLTHKASLSTFSLEEVAPFAMNFKKALSTHS